MRGPPQEALPRGRPQFINNRDITLLLFRNLPLHNRWARWSTDCTHFNTNLSWRRSNMCTKFHWNTKICAWVIVPMNGQTDGRRRINRVISSFWEFSYAYTSIDLDSFLVLQGCYYNFADELTDCGLAATPQRPEPIIGISFTGIRSVIMYAIYIKRSSLERCRTTASVLWQGWAENGRACFYS